MKYKQGDLIKAFHNDEVNLLAHQSNCEGLNYFGGFAKFLHAEYPELTNKHVEHCGNKYIEGTILVFPVTQEKFIVNMYSQIYRGKPSENKQCVDNFETRIELLKACLKQLRQLCLNDSKKIGLPLVASGIAADPKLKGDMTDLEYFKKYIEPVVEKELKDLDVTVYYI